jgi:hypothetical protein
MRVHGRIAFSTEDCTGSKGCSDFLFSAPLVIPDIQKLSGVLKSTYVSQILTPLAKSDVGCSPTIEEEDFIQEHNSLVLQDLNKKNINYTVAR